MQGDRRMKLGIAFSFMFILLSITDVRALTCPNGQEPRRKNIIEREFTIGSMPKKNSNYFEECKPKEKAPTTPKKCGVQGTASCDLSEAEKTRLAEDKATAQRIVNAQAKKFSDTAPKNVAKPKSVKTKSTSASSASKSDLNPEPKANPIAANPTVVEPPKGDSPLEICIKNFDRQVTSCANDAEQANIKCDEIRSEDKEMASVRKTAGEISSGAVKSAIGARAGSGSADQCAQIAMLGNTATRAMNAFKENCDEIYSGCVESCKLVREVLDNGSAFETCKRDLSSAPKEIDGLSADDYLTKQIDRMKNTFNDGDSVCTEAGKKQNLVDQLMRSLGESTRAAKTCQCQLSASTQTGNGNFDPSACAQGIPSPADCFPGAALAGSPACNVYANDDCTLGSGKFNSIPCQCALDNSASVCRTAAGKPAPSNFALDLNSSAGGVSAGAGGLDSSGDASGNMNLNGGYEIKKPTIDSKTSDASTAGGGYANGSGGPGGVGSSGVGSEDPGALGDQEDGSSKGGLSGLFNQVKSSVGDMFGSKNKTGLAGGAKGNSSSGRGPKYNIKDWIPRGVAGTGCQASQLRCKNEDIFTIMSHRYDNNEMTFIQSP